MPNTRHRVDFDWLSARDVGCARLFFFRTDYSTCLKRKALVTQIFKEWGFNKKFHTFFIILFVKLKNFIHFDVKRNVIVMPLEGILTVNRLIQIITWVAFLFRVSSERIFKLEIIF